MDLGLPFVTDPVHNIWIGWKMGSGFSPNRLIRLQPRTLDRFVAACEVAGMRISPSKSEAKCSLNE